MNDPTNEYLVELAPRCSDCNARLTKCFSCGTRQQYCAACHYCPDCFDVEEGFIDKRLWSCFECGTRNPMSTHWCQCGVPQYMAAGLVEATA